MLILTARLNFNTCNNSFLVFVYGCVNYRQLCVPVKACMIHQVVIVNMNFAHCAFYLQ